MQNKLSISYPQMQKQDENFRCCLCAHKVSNWNSSHDAEILKQVCCMYVWIMCAIFDKQSDRMKLYFWGRSFTAIFIVFTFISILFPSLVWINNCFALIRFDFGMPCYVVITSEFCNLQISQVSIKELLRKFQGNYHVDEHKISFYRYVEGRDKISQAKRGC